MLVPGWWVEEGAAAPAIKSNSGARRADRRAENPLAIAAHPAEPVRGQSGEPTTAASKSMALIAPGREAGNALQLPAHAQTAARPAPGSPAALVSPEKFLQPLSETTRSTVRTSRWSGSAWLLVRQGGAGPLAPGGTLGGSQAGARLAYRFAGGPSRPLALTARLSGPLGRAGAEGAVGVEWRPIAAFPFSMLAERRQALGREARSAFAFAVHGGVSRHQVARGVTLDGYAQAGIVGARSRDLFADGSASLSVGAGRVEIGAGVWAGAQPGASRLDLGPRLSVRLPASTGSLRLSAEWRIRVAGDARPGSGPALTLGAGF
jgi:hypothetical protein